MKKVTKPLLVVSFLLLCFFTYNSDSRAQGLEGGFGKKCKTDEKCPLSSYTECDEFGDGTACVCFVCGSNDQ